MLTLVLGKGGVGKTSFAMDDFRSRTVNGGRDLLYIVPEQYSHDAERQLCTVCGNGVSLYGEVLSFSRLSTRVFSELGGSADRILDKAAMILLMHRAVNAVSSRLQTYSAARSKQQLYERLLQITHELKIAGITPESLAIAAGAAKGPLAGKLHDLALIVSAYDGYIGADELDAADRLTRLSGVIADSAVVRSGCIYIDGFTDFTLQEERIIVQLLEQNAELFVCITCDGADDGDEVFELPRRTVRRLIAQAKESGIETRVINMDTPAPGRPPELAYYCDNLFSRAEGEFDGACGEITTAAAQSPADECRYAALRTLELVRGGMRYRDITVAATSWEQYGSLLVSTFEEYGIPVFTGEKSAVMDKPPVALTVAALGIITSGWEYEYVFRYLKTGLAGISQQECDILENYVYKWKIRGAMWYRESDWTLKPDGCGDDADAMLEALNTLRRRVASPLMRLSRRLGSAESCMEMLTALYDFFEDIELPKSLDAKAAAFREAGDMRRHDEYVQLWDMLCRVSQQFAEAAGEMHSSVAEFAQLWSLLLSQYDMGVIPVSIDRVTLSEVGRSRRRDVRALILIGASDDAIPKADTNSGLLSDAEREALLGLGLELPGGGEAGIYRELLTVYSVLSMTADKLIITYSTAGGKRPSLVVRRVAELFGTSEERIDSDAVLAASPSTCFELAVSSLSEPGNALAASAYALLMGKSETEESVRAAISAVSAPRGSLSGDSARSLYGERLSMSATRIDKFSSCRFAYFMQHGLAARPRKPADFDAPAAGTFMHYILENVTRDVREQGGFGAVSEAECRALTEKYVAQYVETELGGFGDKTGRFKYLFGRLARDAQQVVLDMAGELKNSEFEPLEFELKLSQWIGSEDAGLTLRGLVDRVDGWVHDGRLYVRVVDYKTGVKSFSLSDIWHGMGMQMLIYLFALQESAQTHFGREITPAGVLYMPARDIVVEADRNISDEDLAALRAESLRRSGLLLDDESVIEAMESSEKKRYLPVKQAKDGRISGGSLISMERLGKLAAHINMYLTTLTGELRAGDIDTNPFYRNERDNACRYCEYSAACHFTSDKCDRRRYLTRLSDDEFWKLIEEEAEQWQK